MADEAWMRITAAEGVVIGKVVVPTRCPFWFEEEAKKRMAASRRQVDTTDDLMSQMPVKDWVSILYSYRQPIPLRRPLAPEPQEEFVLFPPGKWQEFQEHLAAVAEQDEKSAMTWQRDVPKRIQEFGILTIEHRDKVPPEQMSQWGMIPMSAAFGIKGRTFVTHLPLLHVQGQDRGVNDETHMNWDSIMLWNFFDEGDQWEGISAGHYSGASEVKVATAMPQVIPQS